MSTFPPRPPSVKPEPAPFRPLVGAAVLRPTGRDEAGAVHVLLSSRPQAKSYELIPISTDIGGRPSAGSSRAASPTTC